MTAEIRVYNEFVVGIQGDSIVILNPPGLGYRLTKARALQLAAWIVALAETESGEFERIRHAVERS